MASTTAATEVEETPSIFVRFEQELHVNHVYTPWLQKIEETFHIPRELTASGFLAAWVIFWFLGYFGRFSYIVLVIVLPAFRSIDAVETNSSDDVKECLIYWINFAGVSFLQFVPDLFLQSIRPYQHVKLLFLIWCWLPIENNGSIFMYEKIKSKLLKKKSIGDYVN